MSDDDQIHVTGYAFIHGTHQVYGSDGWEETIPREVLQRAVDATPSVPVRLGGPDGRIIGTAELSVDDVGLKAVASLGWSVAFRVKHGDQVFSDDATKRVINEMSIVDTFVSPLPAQPKDDQ